ncbi:uncharacterized protein LOC121369903 [Gigantopelta aegis]|uniref:uncharacterized protein LOC121369903 n=1 Tax=Gigantopelta aegis TaxID=1735272 RepID=UPI001B88D483|nr:uncharacterized protein LOC121369903 [Gigantopelta aegis]
MEQEAVSDTDVRVQDMAHLDLQGTSVDFAATDTKVNGEEDRKSKTSDEPVIEESDKGQTLNKDENRCLTGLEETPSGGSESIVTNEEQVGTVNETESTAGEVNEQTGYTEAEQKDIVSGETELEGPQDGYVESNPELLEAEVGTGSDTDVADVRKEEYSESEGSATVDNKSTDFEAEIEVEVSGETVEQSGECEANKNEEEPLSESVLPGDQGVILTDEPHPEVSDDKDRDSPVDQSELRSSPIMETESRPPASCKFRYAKTIPTDTSSVIFYTSYNPKEPIVLTWSDAAAAYLSQEMTVDCGDFHGNVLISGKTHPVEEFSVRSYTFEIDLYLSDDVIEDEVGANETQAQEEEFQRSLQPQGVDTFRDINSDLAALGKMDSTSSNSIHLSSKYEDLVRQQLSHKESLSTSLENELDSIHHSASSSKRQTPIGDIVQEHESIPRPDHSSHSSARHTPQRDVVETFEARETLLDSSPVRSLHSSTRTTPQPEVVEDVHKFSYLQTSSRPVSEHSGSFHGSNRVSPYIDTTKEFENQRFIEGQDQRSLDSLQRQSPADERRSMSSHSSARQTPERQINDIVGRTSQMSRHTPEAIADVMETERNISPHRSPHSSLRTTPKKELSREDLVSPAHSQRQSPAREVISDVLRSTGSQERLYEPHDGSRTGSRPSSSNSSRLSASSHQQSMTSEQELSQYLDEPGNRGGEMSRRAASLTGLNKVEPLLPPLGSLGTSSVPPLTGKRITTPDNHIRVPASGSPAVRSPLVTGRASTLSNDSRVSNRTITPVTAESGTREESRRLQDLEDSIVTLRKLLSSREAEVFQLTDQMRDLRDINRSLGQELEHSKKLAGSFDNRELEKEVAQLQTEKEILAKEVVKLQEKLKLKTGETAGLDNYSPHNPVVLQRKIADLEGHIQDMQEVNETAVAKLTKAERQVRELMAENENLRSSRSLALQDLEDDNRRLKVKIQELKGGEADFRSQSEIQQLKDDFHLTRDRNYGLNEENSHWKQEVGDIRHGLQSLDRQVHTSYPARSSLERDRQLTHSEIRQSTGRELGHSSDIRSSAVRDRHLLQDSDIGYGRDEFYQKNPPMRHTPERFALTKENISSLEQSYGSDRGRDKSYRQDGSYLDKYRIHGSSHERTKSEQPSSGYLHSSRPLPDGEVSEKIVQDGLKPSRRPYERLVNDPSGQRKEDFSRGSKIDQDRRDYSVRPTLRSAPFNSRDIYRSVRERSHSESQNETRRLNTPHGDDIMSAAIGRETYPYQSSYYYRSKQDDELQRHYSESSGYLVDGYARKCGDVGISSRNLQDTNLEYAQADFDARRKPYQDDPGEISDTATDILLRGEVVDKKLSRSKNWRRRRSVDSDSVSSLSDPSDEITSSRQRSKSVDAREGWRNKRQSTENSGLSLPSTQHQLSASTERLASTSGSHGSAGFRTVTANQLITQHNKHSLSNTSLNSSLTFGLKPFAPRTPADIKTGDVVKFSRQGGKLSQGTVKYVGHLPGRSDAYLGVELHKEEGKHDGMFDGIRYFKCKPNKGVFVAFNKVVMAWGL